MQEVEQCRSNCQDRISLERVEGQAEQYLQELREPLKTGTYQPQAVKRVNIPKANGGTRPLGIPTVKDRVVQRAIKLVLEPIFEHTFRDSSYGFRPGKDCKDALREVDAWLKAGYNWVVDADIKSYPRLRIRLLGKLTAQIPS